MNAETKAPNGNESFPCPSCRTVLMGNVNRCWNCGQEAPQKEDPGKRPNDSPFSQHQVAPRQSVDHDQRSLVQGMATASLVVGLFSLPLSWYVPHAMFPAVIGLVCGLWSLSHKRSRLVAIALLVCLLASARSARLTYQAFQIWYDDTYGSDLDF